MPTLLHIDVSPRDDHSIFRQVSAAAVSAGAPASTGCGCGGQIAASDLGFLDHHSELERI